MLPPRLSPERQWGELPDAAVVETRHPPSALMGHPPSVILTRHDPAINGMPFIGRDYL
jgi:hypothetical protein